MAAELDFREASRLAGICFFYLFIVMILLLWFGDSVKSWAQKWLPRSDVSRVQEQGTGLSDEDLIEQQQAARQRIQDDLKIKAEDYRERILKPREEARKAEMEKEFYKFAGPAWKGRAQSTRSSDDIADGPGDAGSRPGLRRRDLEGSSRDAAAARQLPESVTDPPRPPPPKTKKERMVISLPDEPDLGAPESITVAVRGVSGLVKKRRFLYTDKIQVLLDWMTKIGYHQKIYTLVTTYPRRDLSRHAQQTLEEVGIDRDTALVVEEIVADDES